MKPYITAGVFNQRLWPRVGDTDECWVCAALMAVHAAAPWLSLPTAKTFRSAAGNPDEPGVIDGGTIPQIVRAIRALYPNLDIKSVRGDLTFTPFINQVKSGRPAVVFVLSSGLQDRYEFGWGGQHAVAVAWDGTNLRIANPLANAHSRWRVISADELQKAISGYPGSGVQAVLMPTVEEAFQAHPLLSGAIAAAKRPLQATITALRSKVAELTLQLGSCPADKADLQTQVAALTTQRDALSATLTTREADLSAALNALASKQTELDTVNQALADARLSLGKWDALKRLFRELLGLSN